ncbi:MAG: hypothetical protein LBT49_02290 [Prevotellaceae bacterium]|jgi:hypothetical protein|nr:hypothetical protein [Prevotellaceae bacterium]
MKISVFLFFFLTSLFAYSQEDSTINYRQKGIELVYQHRYAEAKEAFSQYLESLSAPQRKKVEKDINRFIAICDFSETAIRDSVQVHIENAGETVNSRYDDYNAVVVAQPDTLLLFFTSLRPKGEYPDSAGRREDKEHVFAAAFTGGQAGEAAPSSPSTGKYISVAGVDHSGEGAVFYYKSKKRFGDIYRAKFKKNGSTDAGKRLSNTINSRTGRETGISFTANGDAYFISDRRGGAGGKDIWYAEKSGKRSYKSPKNLGSAINTPLTEEGVEVSADGNTLYFSSNGHTGFGGFDIYKVQRTPDGNWGEPVNMGYPLNSPDDDLFYHITPDTTIALLSSNRRGGRGGLDIYVVKSVVEEMEVEVEEKQEVNVDNEAEAAPVEEEVVEEKSAAEEQIDEVVKEDKVEDVETEEEAQVEEAVKEEEVGETESKSESEIEIEPQS